MVSVRGYFLTIVAVALVATLVLVLDLAHQQRHHLTTDVGHNAARLARIGAAEHERTIGAARQFLELLSRFPQVRGGDGPACNALVAELQGRFPRYLEVGAARADGGVFCQVPPTAGTDTVADRAWFRSAAEAGRLGVGDYRREAIGDRLGVKVAAPVVDAGGRLSAVVFATVELGWLRELAGQADLPPGGMVALVDGDGAVLARHPDQATDGDVGKVEPALAQALAAHGSGIVEIATLDGVPRLLGFTRVDDAAWVIVGVPAPSVVAAGRALADGIGWIAVISIVVLLAAVAGSELLVRRRVEHLVSTARALAAGNFAARTGWRDDGELGQVGRAFDEMADAIGTLTHQTELILDAVDEAVVGIDADERATFLNGVAATLLGGTAAGLVGRSLHGVLRETGGDRDDCPLCAALEDGTLHQSADALLTNAEGGPVPVEYTCRPRHDGGRTVGAVITLKNISARKRAEQERLRQRDSLYRRDKLAAMATLLADVAHELNNPLTVIIAGTTLLRDAAPDAECRRQAALLEQAAERCTLTIRNFLALVRQHPATREEVSLARIVKETLALVAYQIEVDEVVVDVTLPSDLPPLRADAHQLHQVVLNLITNARHALRASAPPRRLTIAARHDAARGCVVLEVADSGPGVPPELRGYVFRPFFTTKSPEEGTGLGLALCHDIVAAHGGTIRVDTAPGGGGLFIVELPLDGGGELEPGIGASRRAAPGGGHVLVVDDDVELGGIIAAALRAEGHEVTLARNGMDALARLEHQDFDVIVSDVRMPRLDGPGLYRELAQRRPDLLGRLVFVTGDVLGRETEGFLERTRVAHLTKPFDIKQIRRIVDDVLHR